MSAPATGHAGRSASRPLRIFLGAFGQPGHAFPMLALGARLAERGHQVTYETWSRWRDAVQVAGMEFVPAPEYPVFPTLGQPLKPYEAVLRAAPVTRVAIGERRPDIVVHDILTLAPALAGELEGAAVATLVPHLYPVGEPGFPPYAIGAQLPRTAAGRALWRALQPATEAGLRRGRSELNEVRTRLGLPALERLHGGLSPQLCLVATFPGLEYPRHWPGHVRVVGPMLWEPVNPDVSLPAGEEPLVLIAPSTAQDPRGRLLRAALSGLAGRGAPAVRVLAVSGGRPLRTPLRALSQSASMRPARGRGARVKLVEWLSYSRTMPHASLVITHAGHGTLACALRSGVPVLAVPHVGDMAENAARVAWSGVGVRLPWRLLSPATLRAAVHQALDADAGYAARAARFAAWAAANDGPTRAAELIEALAERRP